MDTFKGYKNTYHKLNRDLAKSKYDQKVYYDAQSMRVVAHTDQTTGAVTNVRGNLFTIEFPNISLWQSNGDGTFTYRYNLAVDDAAPNYVYYTCPFDFSTSGVLGLHVPIGWANLRDKVIFFTYADNDELYSENTMGFIWEFDTNDYSYTLKYMHRLGFRPDFPIDALGNYENAEIQKVYFTDNYNYFRHINIADPDLPSLPLDFVDIVPDTPMSNVELQTVYYSTGLFKAGTVAYAYNYVNQYGAETKLSPISQQFAVTDKFRGALNEEDVEITFKLQINNVRTDFDYIRVYRLFYSLPDADPVITLIKEELITSTTLSFIDDGQEEVSAISLAQLQFLGVDIFKTKTIATKDNRLFTGNNEYDSFNIDLDTRAYRFTNDPSPVSVIFDNMSNANDSLIVTTNPTGGGQTNWEEVPEEHGCINWGNYAETDTNASVIAQAALESTIYDAYYNQYLYQSDGTTLGAEGVYVKIGVTEVKTPVQTTKSSENPALTYPAQSDSFLPPDGISNIGLKRDEVYRVGIICLNDKGQRSFVNWICDFRMPTTTTHPLIDPSTQEFNQLQLSFELKPAAIALLQAQGVVGYQVVRVHRDIDNRSIQAQGMLGQLLDGTSAFSGNPLPPYMATYGYGNWDLVDSGYGNRRIQKPRDWQGAGTSSDAIQDQDGVKQYHPYLVEFRSPDLNQSIAPGGFFNIHTAAKLSIYGAVVQKNDVGNPVGDPVPTWSEAGTIPEDAYRAEAIFFSNEVRTNNIVRVQPWNGANLLLFDRLDQEVGIVQDGVTVNSIRNRSAYLWKTAQYQDSMMNFSIVTKVGDNTATEDLPAQLGTELFTYTNQDGPGSDISILIADFKRRLLNQYGGPTYADRSRNIYIESSKYVDLSTSPTVVYGDTYTTNMRYQRSQVNPAYDSTAYFPGDVTNSTYKSYVRDIYVLPCEMYVNDDLRDGTYITSSTGTGIGRKDKYEITIDLFHSYNNIYHYIDEYTINRGVKPLRFNLATKFDTETKYSSLKTQGERYDSWIDFRPGNVNYVDGDSGPIEKLIVNNDIMFYFQHYGYGVWNINPNVQVVGEDGTSLELGTGGVLHEYKYVSTNGGCQHNWSVSKNPFGIVWWDGINNKFRMVLGDKNIEANLIGINTYLQNLPAIGNSPILNDGIISGYYKKTNEVYVTFQNGEDSKTWTFFPLNTSFVNTLPTYANMYVQSNGGLFTTRGSKVYHFDKGKMGTFDGTYYPSYITIVMNGDPDIVKKLNNLLWNSEYYDSNGNEVWNNTVTHIRIYNDYQDTGLVQLNDENSERLLREWKFTVPMIGTKGLDRMRSQYHFIQLYFDDDSDSKIVLHDLTSMVVLQT